MSSAAAVHALTPADLETRLAALGIPVARLIAAAHIAHSTWSAWRAGRTRPRPDRWSAATEAFAALVAEAEAAPPAAPAEPSGADVVRLAGCSPSTDARPAFTPVAGDPDAAVIAAAERIADLARREWAATSLGVRNEERLVDVPSPSAEIALRAADRLMTRLNRRLRPACKNLARLRATTPAAVAAKARAVLEVKGTSHSDDWWTALRDSTLRDAARLDDAALTASRAAVEATAPNDPSPSPDRAEMMATVARYHRAGAAVTGDEPADHSRLRAFSDASRAVEILAEDLADRPAVALSELGTKAAVFAAIASEAAMAGESTIGFASEVEDFPRLTRSIIADAVRLCTGGIPLALTAPEGLADLAAEWVRSCAEDWRGDEALQGILKARDEAGFERLKAEAHAHSEVLRRIAGLRSTAPDALALKAAAVLADCRDAAELDADIARLDGTSRGEAEVSVAMSLVRDMMAIHGSRVRALVAAVEAAAAEPPIAAEDMPGDARAAA